MDINPIDGPGGHPIPQTFESRTDEGGAAVTLINKTVVWFEIKTVIAHPADFGMANFRLA